jgi:GH25 family lysozyme M1 (1,4-beta-N-acetylmuramidase)
MAIKAIDKQGREIEDIDRVVAKADGTYHVYIDNGKLVVECDNLFHVRWRGASAAEFNAGRRKPGTPVIETPKITGSGITIIDYGGWSTGKVG